MLINHLRTMTPQRLRAVIEEQYYKTVVEKRTLMSSLESKAKLLGLIKEIRIVEKACVKSELYLLAVICRDTNKELIEMNNLNISRIEP